MLYFRLGGYGECIFISSHCKHSLKETFLVELLGGKQHQNKYLPSSMSL